MDPSEQHPIFHLYAQGKWEEILNKFEKNKFLPWIWPSRRNLEFIGEAVRKEGGGRVISVGCGSGLLEWLLQMATGLEVIGVETDRNWWKSKYSEGTFIPMLLVDDSTKGQLQIDTQNSVLLFCYFNNLSAFLQYIANFRGSCFIGPGPGRGTYTVPEPFHLPGEVDGEWELSGQQEIQNSKDFIAVYNRKPVKN